MDEELNLKPCPFCGASENDIEVRSTVDSRGYCDFQLACSKCGMSLIPYRSCFDANKAWNTRAFEPKTGKWTLYEDKDNNAWECSVCHEVVQLMEGNPQDNKYNFCPNCGARLEMEM